ncbi:MAG TPA: signal peptidase I [Mucilaginibacter sp.]
MKWPPFFNNKTKSVKPKKSKVREWLDAIVFAVVAATIIRGLLFSAYAIPSGSMEGTELIGDYLFVSKFSYGARMPFTPLSIPFLESKVYGFKTYWGIITLPYLRLPGTSEVKKGDIVVFNKPDEADSINSIPVDQRTNLIKRCQATPGDVLTIVNTQVYINGKAAKNASQAQTSYTVVTDGADINPQSLQDMNIEVLNQSTPNTYQMIIPAYNLAAFKSFSNIKSMVPVVQPAGQYDPEVFPHNERFKWNQDNFGPLVLPKRGWSVLLNDSTLTLYRRAMEIYEHNKVEVKGKDVLINGKKADRYTFKMNYYWMMGDNRHNSLDCRFWGYVPEDHIVGKALITVMSIDSTKDLFHKIRWNRVFKPIN